mgnify:CR=1 FL=1
MSSRKISVKCGHLSGTSRLYKVSASTTVEELVEMVGFKMESSDKVLNARTMDEVDTDDKVKANQEYVVSSNLKAR